LHVLIILIIIPLAEKGAIGPVARLGMIVVTTIPLAEGGDGTDCASQSATQEELAAERAQTPLIRGDVHVA
jgi:hypothetical protein